jgi:group II intron reverse transcriptase/maturase
MSARTFDSYFSLDALEADYKALLLSKYDFIREDTFLPAGADRQDRVRFETQLNQHLRAIERKVKQDRWEFSPFLEREVEKTGGGTRTISLSTIRDTLVQRALYSYLYNIVDAELSPACTAYRRGLGAHDAVVRIRRAIDRGATTVVDADIEKFFDTLDHDILAAQLSVLNMDDRARNLLARYVVAARVTSADRDSADSGRPSRYPRTTRSQGLPQGGVLSGMLANLYLAAFDRHMASGPDTLVRYADDFVVCCSSEASALAAHARADAFLKTLSLKLHPTKTGFRDATRGVEFVGFHISPGRTRARLANVDKFKRRLLTVLDEHDMRHHPDADLRALVRRMAFKIEGPVEHVRELIENDLAKHPYRRSWIGYFRIVNDDQQIKALDNWIRRQISRYMWRVHRTKVNATQIQGAGLPSLFGTLWRARAPTRTKPLDP